MEGASLPHAAPRHSISTNTLFPFGPVCAYCPSACFLNLAKSIRKQFDPASPASDDFRGSQVLKAWRACASGALHVSTTQYYVPAVTPLSVDGISCGSERFAPVIRRTPWTPDLNSIRPIRKLKPQLSPDRPCSVNLFFLLNYHIIVVLAPFAFAILQLTNLQLLLGSPEC